MTTPTLSILPSNFRTAIAQLEKKSEEERESFVAGPVESFASSEFTSVTSSVNMWDNVPGLDTDDRDRFVDVPVRENRYQGAVNGDMSEGTSTSMSSKQNGVFAMHVEFSEGGVDIYRLKKQDEVLSGTHMHCDRVTGEAYLVRL